MTLSLEFSYGLVVLLAVGRSARGVKAFISLDFQPHGSLPSGAATGLRAAGRRLQLFSARFAFSSTRSWKIGGFHEEMQPAWYSGI